MKKESLTSAEKTLCGMAKAVLVLGSIGSVAVFFSSCIAWEVSSYSGEIRGMDGINWMGVSALIYCIMATLIAWSVLTILAEISINVRNKSTNETPWQKEFALMIALKDNNKAKEILYRAIFNSVEYKKVLSGGNDQYRKQCVDELNNSYSIYLAQIGEKQFAHNTENELFNVFK